MRRAFSASICRRGKLTQAFGLGWNEAGRWPGKRWRFRPRRAVGRSRSSRRQETPKASRISARRGTSAALGKHRARPSLPFSCFAPKAFGAKKEKEKCSSLVWSPRAAPSRRDCPQQLSCRPYRTSVWLAPLANCPTPGRSAAGKKTFNFKQKPASGIHSKPIGFLLPLTQLGDW